MSEKTLAWVGVQTVLMPYRARMGERHLMVMVPLSFLLGSGVFCKEIKEMIKFDARNYRKHGDKNKELINKSLSECGAGRSILIDANDEIIAGNGVYEQAQALNIPVKVIETDGSELVVVKRTDLDTDDERRKRLAVMDNSASDSSEFDLELLKDDFEVFELQEMGIEVSEPSSELVDETDIDIENCKIKLVFNYKDSRDVIDRFINEMFAKYPDLLEKVEIND